MACLPSWWHLWSLASFTYETVERKKKKFRKINHRCLTKLMIAFVVSLIFQGKKIRIKKLSMPQLYTQNTILRMKMWYINLNSTTIKNCDFKKSDHAIKNIMIQLYLVCRKKLNVWSCCVLAVAMVTVDIGRKPSNKQKKDNL